MRSLEEAMSKKSNLELIEIVKFRGDDFSEEAVVIAERALASRNIDKDEFTELENIILDQYLKKVENNKKRNELKNQINQKKKEIRDAVDPTISNTVETNVNILIAWMLISYVYFLYDYSFFHNLIVDAYSSFGIFEWYLLMVIIFVPVGLVGLWKVKQYGWKIITIFIQVWGLLFLNTLIQDIIYNINRNREKKEELSGQLSIEFEYLLSEYEPGLNLSEHLFNMLIIGGLIYFMHSYKVKSKYSIAFNTQINYIVVSLFICFILLYFN